MSVLSQYGLSQVAKRLMYCFKTKFGRTQSICLKLGHNHDVLIDKERSVVNLIVWVLIKVYEIHIFRCVAFS